MTVYLLGGGPTALAVADSLAEYSQASFVLLEAQASVGGLAQTISWAGHGTHDLGPHKLFTLDPALMRRVQSLLPAEAWLTRSKHSSIYMNGRFLPYPPSPLSLLKIYGVGRFLSMCLDAFGAMLQKKPVGENFEDDLTRRIGKGLYETLIKPIAEKLWGRPRELDAALSRARVQTPAFGEAILQLLRLRTQSKFEALDFQYPRGGLQTIWRAIEEKTRGRGVYLTSHSVTALDLENRRVRTIHAKNRQSGEMKSFPLRDDDFVFSTLPLGQLKAAAGQLFPENARENLEQIIPLNDLLLIFLKIDKPSLFQEAWVFVPDPAVIFHRVSEQEYFDPSMTPGGSIVCCEIMSHALRPLARLSDEALTASCIEGLQKMGFRDFSVLDQKVIRLSKSYPVYKTGFEPKLLEILEALDRFENFRTVGRQGAFKYIGILDTMDIGYGAADWLMNRNAQTADTSWKKERERTRNYPVLD